MRAAAGCLGVVYLAIGLVAGWGPLLVVLGVCTLATSLLFGLDELAAWREARRQRRVAYRRWRAWEFQAWLARHTGWRKR